MLKTRKSVSEILRDSAHTILTLDDLDRLAERSYVLGRRPTSFAACHGTVALGAREFLLWRRSVRRILHTSILTSIVSCRIQTRRGGLVGASQLVW